MAWVIDAYARNELEIGEHQRCPHYHPRGEVQLNACEKHKYVMKWWFERRFSDTLRAQEERNSRWKKST